MAAGRVLETPTSKWLSVFPKRLWELGSERPKLSKQILNIMSGIFARSRLAKDRTFLERATSNTLQ